MPAGKEERIFYLEIPVGSVGFLYKIGVNRKENISWIWIIDREIIHEEIGTLEMVAYYDPPFLIKRFIELRAKNNSDNDILLKAYCDGIYYGQRREQKQDTQKDIQMVELLKEIRDKLHEERTEGKVFDKKVEVTDKIKMLYEPGGLNWTACDITNIGANDVYFCINKWKRPEAPLEPNLTANIDLGKKGAIKRIYFVCDSGKSTTVYIRVLK